MVVAPGFVVALVVALVVAPGFVVALVVALVVLLASASCLSSSLLIASISAVAFVLKSLETVLVFNLSTAACAALTFSFANA